MSETARIADQLRRAFEGEAWHGPALLEILAEVRSAMAVARPIPKAHSIWELTLHIQSWEKAALAAMRGEPTEVREEENFPAIGDHGEAAWHQSVAELRNTHRDLLGSVAHFPESQLSDQVPGKDYDFYFLLHGLAQHALYHAGQIMLIKRAQVP